MKAPTGRKASVMVIVSASCASDLPNSLAIAVRAKTTRKKSKASRVQPRKLAKTAARWPRGATAEIELGACSAVLGMRQYARIATFGERLHIVYRMPKILVGLFAVAVSCAAPGGRTTNATSAPPVNTTETEV